MGMNYYIHVPFCASKCGYCVFYSRSAPAEELLERYLEKLFSQLVLVKEKAETIYIGGGTPTFLDDGRLERLLEKVYQHLVDSRTLEISIEANPETLTPSKVALLRRYVTRISTGVQSFFPETREILGRKCDEKQLKTALDLIAGAGFPHWNCDLIYAVPGRTAADWEREFDRLALYPVDHVSCYNLTPEEGAALYGKLVPEEDISTHLEEITRERLEALGIRQYEVSNYAGNGCVCRHNVNVWRGGFLTGLGPSAAGFDGKDRVIEVSSLSRWLAGEKPEIDRISPRKRLNEIFAVNLRTVEGWTPRYWQLVPGADDWSRRLECAGRTEKIYPGCFEIAADRIQLSRKGLSFWDTIAEELLDEY